MFRCLVFPLFETGNSFLLVTRESLQSSDGQICVRVFGLSAILCTITKSLCSLEGAGSGGAKVLGKLPVPGRPTHLDHSGSRAYCACSTCGWVLFGLFSFVYHHLYSFSLSLETARYRLKFCLKGPFNPKQPTN